MKIFDAVPALRRHTRTGVHLNPRAGAPTADESSIGGPLLWPATEPWPVCADDHFVEHREDLSRTDREALQHVHRRMAERARSGARANELTTEEAEVFDRVCAGGHSIDLEAWQLCSLRPEVPAQAVAMVPVLQLFRADMPGGRWPEGKDLLQVLWCPNGHAGPAGQDDHYHGPTVALRWRDTTDVGDILTDPPAPSRVEDDDYLPQPCVIEPSAFLDLPDRDDLPLDVWEQVSRWSEESGHDYHDLACAEGWKYGGWPTWRLTDLQPIDCTCGTRMRLLLTMESTIEAPGIAVGRFGQLRIFTCPRDIDHPVRLNIQ